MPTASPPKYILMPKNTNQFRNVTMTRAVSMGFLLSEILLGDSTSGIASVSTGGLTVSTIVGDDGEPVLNRCSMPTRTLEIKTTKSNKPIKTNGIITNKTQNFPSVMARTNVPMTAIFQMT